MLIYALAFVLDGISESFYNEEHMRRSSSPDDGSMKNEMDKIENGDCHNSKTEEKDTTDIFASRDALFHDGYRRCNPSYRTRSKDVLFYTVHSLFCYSSRVFCMYSLAEMLLYANTPKVAWWVLTPVKLIYFVFMSLTGYICKNSFCVKYPSLGHTKISMYTLECTIVTHYTNFTGYLLNYT